MVSSVLQQLQLLRGSSRSEALLGLRSCPFRVSPELLSLERCGGVPAGSCATAWLLLLSLVRFRRGLDAEAGVGQAFNSAGAGTGQECHPRPSSGFYLLWSLILLRISWKLWALSPRHCVHTYIGGRVFSMASGCTDY